MFSSFFYYNHLGKDSLYIEKYNRYFDEIEFVVCSTTLYKSGYFFKIERAKRDASFQRFNFTLIKAFKEPSAYVKMVDEYYFTGVCKASTLEGPNKNGTLSLLIESDLSDEGFQEFIRVLQPANVEVHNRHPLKGDHEECRYEFTVFFNLNERATMIRDLENQIKKELDNVVAGNLNRAVFALYVSAATIVGSSPPQAIPISNATKLMVSAEYLLGTLIFGMFFVAIAHQLSRKR